MSAATAAARLPAPPVAPREARDVSVHGDARSDEYFWLRDRDDPRTLPYLTAENGYADAWFAPHAALKERLYQEMLSRIQQDDDSVPMRKGDWWYSTGRAAASSTRTTCAGAPSDPIAATTRTASTRPSSTSTRWRAASPSFASASPPSRATRRGSPTRPT